LQEPVRKILSFGDLLNTSAGPALDGAAREYLARMLGAAARMRTLISDLLLYSQVTTRVRSSASTNARKSASFPDGGSIPSKTCCSSADGVMTSFSTSQSQPPICES